MAWIAHLLSEVEAREAVHLVSVRSNSRAQKLSEFARRRLRVVRLVESDDQMRWLALMKLRNLVLADPHLTTLGSSLMNRGGQMVMEREIAASFNDAFSSKSTATRGLDLRGNMLFGLESLLSTGTSLIWKGWLLQQRRHFCIHCDLPFMFSESRMQWWIG